MRTSPSFLRHPAPRAALILGIAALAMGCGSVVVIGPNGNDAGSAVDAAVADVPSVRDVPLPPTDRVAPRTCTRSSDCRPGETCSGGEGCGIPWTCGPALGRPCTDDLSPFCACDGQTFFGSSTCPDRPYAHRGPCEMPPPPIDAGPPPGCPLPDGRVCPVGQMCPLDRCTVCFCAPDGSLRCTGGACPPDSGVVRACQSNADCGGALCMGPEGCGTRWTCATGPVGCTADLSPFCGCDGQTFYGSSSCPGRTYAHRGPCATADAGVTCAAMDARGEGLCDLFLGFAWNGNTCVGQSGCRCVGADCARLFRDPMSCVAAYRACLLD